MFGVFGMFSGLIDDGLVAWSWVKSKAGEAPMYIWGHSLGSGSVDREMLDHFSSSYTVASVKEL